MQEGPLRRVFLFCAPLLLLFALCLYAILCDGVLWTAVDDTPRVWITCVLRPQGTLGLHAMAGALFNRGMSNAVSFSQIPPVPLPSNGGWNVRVARSDGSHDDSDGHDVWTAPGRRTVSPQRFYTPSAAANGAISQWADMSGRGGSRGPMAGVGNVRSRSAETDRTSVSAAALGNVVTVDAAFAGIGASTLAALLSRELTERGCKSVLVDADLAGGGLDVLLGVENEDGTRFGDVSAPLGNIDGKALVRELPVWDGVPLLACDPWKNENPQSWEVQSCVRALAHVRDAVVVDVGQWHSLRDVPELTQAIRVTVVELTVLGLARAKAAMQSKDLPYNRDRHLIVGIEPRGAIRNQGATTIEEAENYLDRGLEAVVRPDARLCGELLDGLGLRRPNRQTAKALAILADGVQEALEGKQGDHGTRTP